MASTTKVLRFTKTTWNQPIVCRLASDYGLTFNILKAFINEVEAQSGNHIQMEAANLLIEDARMIMMQTAPMNRLVVTDWPVAARVEFR